MNTAVSRAFLYSTWWTDSCAVALLMGENIPGGVHLLTYMHQYGALFNEWSRRHNEDLVNHLGDRVYHHLVDSPTFGMKSPNAWL